MRQTLVRPGAEELTYEIREIVKKADVIKKLGQEIFWENIGDPIQKNCIVPDWIKKIVSDLANQNQSYGYCSSKGVLATREFLAKKTNALGGAQITADDILFFNGLGDAIATIYNLLASTSRVIGPSPAYSTHSSAEGAHAHHSPITYLLDPANSWYPDLNDLYNKVKYNPSITGILIINPDNPTGMVYPLETLKEMVAIAREFDLFILCDEIYNNITYNGVRAYALAEIIEDVPGIAMKGISKEFPWPGSRCGWMEYYNKESDEDFSRLCRSLDDAKMIEVCSTTLPQLAIPQIMSDPRYEDHRLQLNTRIGKRSQELKDALSDIPELIVNQTFGAFYNTIVFKTGSLNHNQYLEIANPEIKTLIESWCHNVDLDYRFVYYLLGATGICVVPISSFCSELLGFRITLLEEDEKTMVQIFETLKKAIRQYLDSAQT